MGSICFSGQTASYFSYVWHALFLALPLLIRTVSCSGIGLGSGGNTKAVTRSIPSPSCCLLFSHLCIICFCIVSILRASANGESSLFSSSIGGKLYGFLKYKFSEFVLYMYMYFFSGFVG